MSITSTLIGSMGSINTALTAMGVNDLQAKQEEGEQKAAALSASQEVAKLRQTRKDASDLIKRAEDMSPEGGTGHMPRDVYMAANLGAEERMKDAEAILSKYYPKLYAKAQKGGINEESRIKYDIQKYIDEMDKNGYTGSFEAYHARAVKQRARDDLQRKKDRARREKDRARRERMSNG